MVNEQMKIHEQLGCILEELKKQEINQYGEGAVKERYHEVEKLHLQGCFLNTWAYVEFSEPVSTLTVWNLGTNAVLINIEHPDGPGAGTTTSIPLPGVYGASITINCVTKRVYAHLFGTGQSESDNAELVVWGFR
jgi:hypothetical protein